MVKAALKGIAYENVCVHTNIHIYIYMLKSVYIYICIHMYVCIGSLSPKGYQGFTPSFGHGVNRSKEHAMGYLWVFSLGRHLYHTKNVHVCLYACK